MVLARSGLGATYCPPPREWCSTLRRCLDPSNPDTPCEAAPATSLYSTTTSQTTEYIRPEGREEVRSDEQAAADLAADAQRKLDALGIDGDCRSYVTCPIGLDCYNDVSCYYGGTEHDAGAIMSSHDITLVTEARKEGIVVGGFPETSYGGPAGNYEILEQPSSPALPDPILATTTPEYLGPGPLPPPLEDAFVGGESLQAGGPVMGWDLRGLLNNNMVLLGAAGIVALLVLRK